MGTNQLKIENKLKNFIYGRRVIREFILSTKNHSGIKEIHMQKNLPADLVTLIQKNISKVTPRLYDLNQLQERFPVNHQGILIELSSESYPGFSNENWKEFLAAVRGPHICLDRIQDSQNFGTIIRSCEALGASSIICCGPGSPVNDTVHRVSSGASFHIPKFFVQNLAQFIKFSKSQNYWICASGSKTDLEGIVFGKKHQPLLIAHNEKEKLPQKENIILLIGSEGDGLKKSAITSSDFLISIPIAGKTPSLNINTATAILLDRIIS